MADELFKNVGKEAPAKTEVKTEPKAETKESQAEQKQEAQRQATSPVSLSGSVDAEGKPANETPVTNEDQGGDNDEGGEGQTQQPDELTMLKSRAKLMGITFSNNIGLDALKTKIEEHKQAAAAKTQASAPASTETAPKDDEDSKPVSTPMAKKISLRDHLQNEAMKLVRLRITNLDPKKKDLQGEILTVANEYIGTVRKFVPFGEATDNGYHVPYCLYEMMRDRKFLSIKTRKGPKGQTIVEQQMVREFALEILPPLTEAELARLSAAQQAAGGLE